MTENLKQLKERTEYILKAYENQNSATDITELDETFFELEGEVLQFEGYDFNSNEINTYKYISKILSQIRKDYDLYDENAERETMFPNGEDE